MCKMCDLKPKWFEDETDKYFLKYANTISLGSDSTDLFVGVEENGKIYLSHYLDNDPDPYYPKFCPECGKPLSEIPQEVKDENKSKPAEWISVKDRLPEQWVDVVGLYDTGIVEVTRCINHLAGFSYEGSTFGSVTHWLPIPEKPKEDN